MCTKGDIPGDEVELEHYTCIIIVVTVVVLFIYRFIHMCLSQDIIL